MAYTDREILKNRQIGQAQTFGCSDPNTAVAQEHSWFATFAKAADDGAAATATSETYTGTLVPYKARLRSLSYVATTGGITGDATNNATITIKIRDNTGGNAVTVATLTTTASVTQGAAVAMTLTLANVVIPAGATFTLTIAKGGTGVVVRAGTFTAELENV